MEIETRYTAESSSCSNLSCGNNLDFLNIQQGEMILDLGCGRGLETIQAAKSAGPSGKAIGLDLTPAMIQTAKANAQIQDIANVDFVVGDIENLPFPAAAFDAVISNCVINHAKNKLKVYQEIHRVLMPGGRFVISDAVTKNPLPDSIKNDPDAWAQCFGGAVTRDEYLKSIQDAGFQDLRILKQREYLKNDCEFISLTLAGIK